MQQEIDNHFFNAEHIKYPVGYYARRIKHPKNWKAFSEFLDKYEYDLAKQLINTTFGLLKPSPKVDDI